jgi:large subunit ribosomal protein L6
MSRVGLKPIPLPNGVEVQVDSQEVTVKGPKGTLAQRISPAIHIDVSADSVRVQRSSDARQHRALHGLTRALINNMVVGVTEGFERILEIQGVGYRVQKTEQGITLQVGYTHLVEITPMPGLLLEVEGNNRIIVRGINKETVGEMAARIRRVRPPDSYKGKGIRYAGEIVRLKPGKSAGRN